MAPRRRSARRTRPHDRLILVVDDNEDARDMYALYFEHVGFRVATAADGNEALRKASELTPDVIIMDLTMPGMDGLTATRRLKADATLRTVPVIAVTGHALKGASDDARAAGVDRYVVKPCLPEELARVVDELLG